MVLCHAITNEWFHKDLAISGRKKTLPVLQLSAFLSYIIIFLS